MNVRSDRSRKTAQGRSETLTTSFSECRLAGQSALQEQVRDHRSQPPVRRIVLVSLVPVLLDGEARELERRWENLDVGNSQQGVRHALRHGDHHVGAGDKATDAEEV